MSLGDQSRKPPNGHYSMRQVPVVKHPRTETSSSQAVLYPPTPPSNSHEKVTIAMDSPVTPHQPRKTAAKPATRSGSSQINPPTPVQTPPVALSPPQRFPSRMSSSVAESFKTAREDPWLSSDNISLLPDSPYLNGIAEVDSEGKDSGLDVKKDLDHTPTQSRIGLSSEFEQLSTIPNGIEEIPSREWDTNIMRNVTIRRRNPQINGIVVAEKRPESPISTSKTSTTTSSSGRGPVTPPTIYIQNGIWQTTPPSQANTSLPTINGSPQYDSRMSSASTIIEAIIITTPKKEPRPLRRVSAAYSLRDAHKLPGSGRSSVRVSSDSSTLVRPKQRESFSTDQSPPTQYEKDPRSRATTDPGLRKVYERDSLRDDVSKAKHFSHSSSRRTSHRRVNSELSPVTSPTSSSFEVSSSASQLQRAISQSSSHSRASHYSIRSATHRALETALAPAFVPQPSSTSESLVTIIKRASSTSERVGTTPPRVKSNAPSQKKDEHVPTFSPLDEDLLAPPSNIGVDRRASDAGSARSRISTDRFTMKSEDHPRFVYSQTTPFSQISAFSARDALEVGEAKAVDIYPHNNHSLLLVEQGTSSRPSPPSTTQEVQEYDIQPTQAKPELITVQVQPSTPPTQDGPFSEEIDSPLKNPRKPPLPPTINILPATPAYDENANPMDEATQVKDEASLRPGLLQRARRYSDNLLVPFLTRSASLKRNNSYHSQHYKKKNSDGPAQMESADRHLHPDWRPRNYLDNRSSDSESDFGDEEEDDDRLPAGGDTSEHPPPSIGFLPRRMTKKLPGFRGTGGFLIGNSLGVERHGTNVRRHYIHLPKSIQDRRSENGSTLGHHLQHKHSSSNLNLAAKSTSLSSLRSAEAQRRRRRARRKLQLHVEWIGFGGLKDRWRDRSLARKEKKAEQRRDVIRRSIGPKFLIEQGVGNIGNSHPL